MDVTFLEHQAHFPKTQLQRKISRNSNSNQFWDITLLANIDIVLPTLVFKSVISIVPTTTCNSSPKTIVVPFKLDSTPNIPTYSIPKLDSSPNFPIDSTLKSYSTCNLQANLTLKLQVYSRRKVVRDIQILMPSAHDQITEPNPNTHDQNSGNTVTDTNLTVLNDLDVPIAFRKGVRSCITHLIVDFASY